MDGRYDDIGPESAGISAEDFPVRDTHHLLPQTHILRFHQGIHQGFSAAPEAPGASLIGLYHVLHLEGRTGRYPHEGPAVNAFVLSGFFPGKVRKAEGLHDFAEGTAGLHPAHGMEAGVEADAFAYEGLEGTAGLQALFQDGYFHPGPGHQFAQEQASQAASDDDVLFRHSSRLGWSWCRRSRRNWTGRCRNGLQRFERESRDDSCPRPDSRN